MGVSFMRSCWLDYIKGWARDYKYKSVPKCFRGHTSMPLNTEKDIASSRGFDWKLAMAKKGIHPDDASISKKVWYNYYVNANDTRTIDDNIKKMTTFSKKKWYLKK